MAGLELEHQFARTWLVGEAKPEEMIIGREFTLLERLVIKRHCLGPAGDSEHHDCGSIAHAFYDQAQIARSRAQRNSLAGGGQELRHFGCDIVQIQQEEVASVRQLDVFLDA